MGGGRGVGGGWVGGYLGVRGGGAGDRVGGGRGGGDRVGGEGAGGVTEPEKKNSILRYGENGV